MGYAQWHMHNTAYYHHMVLCYFDWKTPLKISAYAPLSSQEYQSTVVEHGRRWLAEVRENKEKQKQDQLDALVKERKMLLLGAAQAKSEWDCPLEGTACKSLLFLPICVCT